MNSSIAVFHGPNLYRPCPGVAIRFRSPFAFAVSTIDLERQWQALVDKEESLWRQGSAENKISFLAFAARVAALFSKNRVYDEDETIASGHDSASGSSWIFLRHVNPVAASSALLLAMHVSSQVFSAASGARPAPAIPDPQQIAALRAQIPDQLPPPPMQLLMRAAHSRGIPFYPTSLRANVWQFGQGANGKHLLPWASERDSLTGARLAVNKVISNDFVRRLGYPAVRHAVARDADQALRIAGELGYPVVVKPIAQNMGRGVTAGIDDPSEIPGAFELAAAYARRVLVERYVEGTDHRIAVFGGTFAWVGAKHPARVVGDGRQSISGLMAEENRRRLGDHTRSPILRDEAMDRLLARRKLTYDHCPDEGVEIRLRTVSNIAMGGTWEELSEIHPDTVDMAESLARAFRMDAFGIDFITSDIRRSWRDGPCAIIEVNDSPGFYSLSEAERVLGNEIPVTADVRIPSVLLVDCPPGDVAGAAALWTSPVRRVGVATAHRTLLGARERGQPADTLQARVDSLIADPGCAAMVVSSARQHILDHGLPLDRFTAAVYPDDLPANLSSLIRMHCDRTRTFRSREQMVLALGDVGGVLAGPEPPS